MTASASGAKRYRATPLRKNIGKKTIQMHIVETRAGTAICAAPSRMPSWSAAPSSRWRSIFSIVTVASSTRIPTARARPPSVMMLMVSCRKLNTMTEVRMDNGIEIAMITVLPAAQEDENHQTSKRGGDDSLTNHPSDCSAHEDGLIGKGLNLQFRRKSLGHTWKKLSHTFDDIDRGRVSGLENGDQRAAFAILPNDICLRCKTVAYGRYIAHI